MTVLMNFVSPSAMQSLGWALLHFLWQGTALAALAAAAMALCRRASSRYLCGVGALLLMLLAPVATFWFYSQQHSSVTEIARASSFRPAWPTAASKSAVNSTVQPSSVTPSLDALPWLVEAWLIGVAFFSLRTAGGFLLLQRQQRRRSSLVSGRLLEMCRTMQSRIGLKRAIRFCECTWLQAPAVLGWFR